MLQLEPIELILRAIPEGFLYMGAAYVFSNIKIFRLRTLFSAIIIGLAIYFFRSLPVNYGVHTILTILFTIFFNIIYNKIDVVSSMKGTMICFIFQLVSELINVSLLNLLNLNIDILFRDPIIKNILGIPSLLITLLLILGYKFMKNRGKNEFNKKNI